MTLLRQDSNRYGNHESYVARKVRLLPPLRQVKLADIARRLTGETADSASVMIRGVAHDSRRVRPGDVFVCRRGLVFDGHDFAPEAVQRGAVALVVNRKLPLSVPQVVVPDTRVALGLVAAEFYGEPSRELRVIGVTGTKGKTTTTYLIQHLLEATGRRAGLIGTILQVAGKEVRIATRTTPEASDIQELLSLMVEASWEAAVIEVSSHAVELKRTVGTEFDVAVFTNITRDHMDFHPTFQHYLAAKTGFFAQASVPGHKEGKVAVINVDDPHWSSFAQATTARIVRVGIENEADLRAGDVEVTPKGVNFRVTGSYGETRLELQLTGRFNVYNALCALGAVVGEGVPLDLAARALSEVSGVPGRFERIDVGQDFSVIVDYAHTEDSLRNVLTTARSFARGRVLAVCGAGGDRDKGKRPLMGRALAECSDYVIVTSDNPRSEVPERICEDIVAGIRDAHLDPSHYEVLVDRREAIRRAIAMAKPGDVVIIAGKGHETYQQFANHTIHFDDREEARAALETLRT